MQPHTLTTPELLANVATELDHMIALVHRVETCLPSITSGQPQPPKSEAIRALQSLDLLMQTLAALADFLREARPSEADNTICVTAALQQVNLSDLAMRLRQRVIATDDPKPPLRKDRGPETGGRAKSADVELF